MAPEGRMKGNCPVKGLGRVLGSNSVKCCWEVGEIRAKDGTLNLVTKNRPLDLGIHLK